MPGTRVTVLDRAGHETSGQVTTLSADTLSLRVHGTSWQITEADAVRIVRRGDSLKNGALWGLAVGGAMGAAAVTTCDPDCRGGWGPGGAIAFFAAGGMGLGALVDWLHRGKTNIYEAPRAYAPGIAVAPVLTRRGGGVLVGVRF